MEATLQSQRPQGAGGSSHRAPTPLDFIAHGEMTLETRRELLNGLVTPSDQLFVRGNLGFPNESILEDRDGWTLEVEGVGSPKSLTLADLKGIGHTTTAAVLQCSGNGRKFFEHGPSGSPWGVGAAGNVLWTGVALREVIDALGGVAGGAKFITGTGGEDVPADIERTVIVERSVPIEPAMENALLAWDMNSEPLSLSHGGPLRLVVPGYYGVNNVKYLKKLAATTEESDAKIQQTSYRVRPIGADGAPDQPSMWDMNVKSWVSSPLASRTAGKTHVTGVAFSGQAPIESVEVSTDGGGTWSDAELVGPDLGPFAWRQFALAWDARPGEHTLASRARDAAGNVQPELRVENHRGYKHNGWRDPAVTIAIS